MDCKIIKFKVNKQVFFQPILNLKFHLFLIILKYTLISLIIGFFYKNELRINLKHYKWKTLTSKGIALQNLTFSMIATLAHHISVIQSPFSTKIIGLDSNSNLVFVVSILAQFKILYRFGMHSSAKGFSFGLYLQCKIWGIFHYCKAIFGYKNFFS